MHSFSTWPYVSLAKHNPPADDFWKHWKKEEVNGDTEGFCLNVAEIEVKFE